jgi:hypothetical protein
MVLTAFHQHHVQDTCCNQVLELVQVVIVVKGFTCVYVCAWEIMALLMMKLMMLMMMKLMMPNLFLAHTTNNLHA